MILRPLHDGPNTPILTFPGMTQRTLLLATVAALASALVACGGADQNPLLGEGGVLDSSAPADASVPDTAPPSDATVIDSPGPADVNTVDVPVGPKDSRIMCGTSLTCSAQTEVCCHHTSSIKPYECVATVGDCANPDDIPISCSMHDNCASQGNPTYVCCGDITSNSGACSTLGDVSCQATCDPQSDQLQVGCSGTDPCPTDTPNCKVSTCTLPGYNICVQ